MIRTLEDAAVKHGCFSASFVTKPDIAGSRWEMETVLLEHSRLHVARTVALPDDVTNLNMLGEDKSEHADGQELEVLEVH